jgi:sarcosine oxidase, subunit delta
MKILVCPLNGPRPVSEFAFGGEVRLSPDPNTCSDAEWSSYVFNRSGSPGAKYEWWCHIASGFWFVVLRDTARDVVIDTFPAEVVRGGLASAPSAGAASPPPAGAASPSLAGAIASPGATSSASGDAPDAAP